MSEAIDLELETGAEQFKEAVRINNDKTDTVTYKLRDRNQKLIAEWENVFAKEIKSGAVEVSAGDIFEGAPCADAIVSPANSFGFMDGGIDYVYSMHFGWQMQHRLQVIIRQKYHGELLVGQAEIIPTFEGGAKDDSMTWTGFNEDKPIKYLISAPTMRVPLFVDDTINAYLAFRAVILAVDEFNEKSSCEKIKTVLCPGLGTAVGKMPFDRCAYQMKQAYETFVLGECDKRIYPTKLDYMNFDNVIMQKFKRNLVGDDDNDDVSENSFNRRIAPPKTSLNYK